MKKFILILLTVCAIQTSYSQTEKGRMFIGGLLNLAGDSNSDLDTLRKYDYNSITFTIAPNFGYFIADNFAIGGNINFGTTSLTSTNDYTGSTTSLPSIFSYKSSLLRYGLCGFASYYTNITDNFKLYFSGSLNYYYSSEKRTLSNNDTNHVYSIINPENQEIQSNGLSLVVTPGLVYFITPKIGIHSTFGSIYYSYSSSKNKSLPYDNQYKSNQYGIALNLSSIYFGVNYYF